MFRNRYRLLTTPERRAFWTAIVIAVAFTLFSTTVFDTLVNAPHLQYRFANAVPFIIAIVAYLGAYFMYTGRATAGAWLIHIGALLLLGINATQAEGFGFPSAFIVLSITLYVPVQILKGRYSSIALWIGLVGSVGIVLLDTFWEGTRVPALAQDVTTASILSIVLHCRRPRPGKPTFRSPRFPR